MKSLNNITYGLFVVTTRDGEKHNGAIINTFAQITSNPIRVTITINKDNQTTKIIEKTGMFNVSVLDTTTNFELIKRFGFQSGKDCDKFDGFEDFKSSNNGIRYITQSTNAYFSCAVVGKVDHKTHITYEAEILEEGVLLDSESLTYSYYHKFIKPKQETANKGVFVCKICGYIYDGETIPDDFICPICKHGREAFEFRPAQLTTKKDVKSDTKSGEYKCRLCGSTSKTPQEWCGICGGRMTNK